VVAREGIFAMNRFRQIWYYLDDSFWFKPLLLVMGSIALALALITTDYFAESDRWIAQWPRLFGFGAEGARAMMSTIAGSMITVLGVMYSMILVVLALASSQYTSRILQNFIRNSITQIVLGLFAGIFTYCLIVLSVIHGGEESYFVPSLSVFFGFIMALGGVFALIIFIHHVAMSVQASTIIASAAQETKEAINHLFPEQLGEGPDEDDDDSMQNAFNERIWQAVPSRANGYIQGVDTKALLSLAREKDTIVRMDCGVGNFVVRKTALASIALDDPPDQETIAAIQETFFIDNYRTLNQDAAFGIRQIVDIALKALSPGVVETTTAVICLDHLTVIMARLISRKIPSLYRYEEGKLRVIAKVPGFKSLLGESFDQIRNHANGDFTIMLQLIESLQTLASLEVRQHHLSAIREQLEAIGELAERTIGSDREQEMIKTHLALVLEKLNSKSNLG
jgi:uncharacterized membrane protein